MFPALWGNMCLRLLLRVVTVISAVPVRTDRLRCRRSVWHACGFAQAWLPNPQAITAACTASSLQPRSGCVESREVAAKPHLPYHASKRPLDLRGSCIDLSGAALVPSLLPAFRCEAADAFSPWWSEAQPRVTHPHTCSTSVDCAPASPTPRFCHLRPPHAPPSSASIASKPLSSNTFRIVSKILSKTV